MVLQVWLEIISLTLLVIGALNWGLVGALKFNAVSWLARHSFQGLEPAIYLLVGLAALVHLFSRDYYLRFLGRAVFPCGSLVARVPEGANTEVTVHVAPGVNVIYWAAEPAATQSHVASNPWVAYQKYANAGVAVADAQGTAVLKFRTPTAYKVGSVFKKTLRPHVHYRVCDMSGMLSPVKTLFV